MVLKKGMVRIVLLLGLFFFHPFTLSAQFILIKEGGKKIERWEGILQQEVKHKDTVALKKFLSPLRNKNSADYDILYLGLMANGYANFFDNINTQSDYFYHKSISNAKELGSRPLQIWAKLNYASYLYKYRKATLALPVFLTAMDEIAKTDPDEIIFPAASFKIIGYYLGTIGDKQASMLFLTKALAFCPYRCSQRAEILDNLGLLNFDLKQFASAEQYFHQASEMALKLNDKVRYAKSLGNRAQIEAEKKNYNGAIALLKQDIAISKAQGAEQNTMYAFILLGQYQLEFGDIDEAERSLLQADSIARLKPYYLASELQAVKLLKKLYNQQNRETDELYASRRVDVLEAAVMKTDGDFTLKQANWMAQKARFQKNIDQTNLKLRRESIWRYGLSFFTLLLVGGWLLFWMKAKRDSKKQQYVLNRKQKEHSREKQKYQKKLEKANQTLAEQIAFFHDKTNQIEQLQQEIEDLKESKSSDREEKNSKLNELLQSHLMTNQNWQNFRREFQYEYPEFYHTLHEDFPEITESNLRIILLQKLGFNNVEVSSLLGITPDAVKKSKQRLKRKLGDKSDELFSRIMSN